MSAQCGSVVMGKWAPGLAGPPPRPGRCLSRIRGLQHSLAEQGQLAEGAGLAGRWAVSRTGAGRVPVQTPCLRWPVWFWPRSGSCVGPVLLQQPRPQPVGASRDPRGPPPCREAQDRGCSSCTRLLWGLWFHIPDFSFLIPLPPSLPPLDDVITSSVRREEREGGGWGHLLMRFPPAESPAPHLLVLQGLHGPLCRGRTVAPLWAAFLGVSLLSSPAFTPVLACRSCVWPWTTDWIAPYLSFPIKWELKLH